LLRDAEFLCDIVDGSARRNYLTIAIVAMVDDGCNDPFTVRWLQIKSAGTVTFVMVKHWMCVVIHVGVDKIDKNDKNYGQTSLKALDPVLGLKL
jgi:hypothetical protein